MLLTSHWPLLSTQLSYMEQVNTILLYCGSLRLAVKPTPFFSRVLGWDSARMPAHPPGPTPPSLRTQRKVTGQSLSMLISYHSPVDTHIILFICGEWEFIFWDTFGGTQVCVCDTFNPCTNGVYCQRVWMFILLAMNEYDVWMGASVICMFIVLAMTVIAWLSVLLNYWPCFVLPVFLIVSMYIWMLSVAIVFDALLCNSIPNPLNYYVLLLLTSRQSVLRFRIIVLSTRINIVLKSKSNQSLGVVC